MDIKKQIKQQETHKISHKDHCLGKTNHTLDDDQI